MQLFLARITAEAKTVSWGMGVCVACLQPNEKDGIYSSPTEYAFLETTIPFPTEESDSEESFVLLKPPVATIVADDLPLHLDAAVSPPSL
jgi:hypothetical protein